MIGALKPYAAMKNSCVPWLRDVPQHWEVRRLKQAFRKIVGGSTPASTEATYWDGNVVWVTPADISRTARLASSLRRITREGLMSCSSELVPPGTIVVTSRATVGNVAIAEIELCTNQGCKALVATADVVNPVFGLHVLATLKSELQSLATGTTFTEISTARLGAVAIPLPSVDEQVAIVRFLDHADRRIRRYIRAKQKLIKLLEEQKQAIIHRAVTRGFDPNVRLKPSGVEWLGDVPEHWDVCPVGGVCTYISYGFTNPMPGADTGPYMLTANDIGDGVVRYATARRTTQAAFDSLLTRKSRPHLGDVLVTKDGTLGRVAVADGQTVCINQSVALLRPDLTQVQPEYLALALCAPLCQERMRFEAGGTTIKHIYITRLAKMRLPIPAMEEQAALLLHVDQTTSEMDRARKAATSEIALLREYRTRLIADVVTGKLDVREAAANLPDGPDEAEALDEADAQADDEDTVADDPGAEAEESAA